MSFLNHVLYGNAIQTWLIAVGIMALTVIVLQVVKSFSKNRLVSLIEKSSTEIDDFFLPLLRQTRLFFFIILGIYLGSLVLTLPEGDGEFLLKALRVAFFLQLGFWGMGLIAFYVNRGVSGRLDEDEGETATTIDAFGLVAKIVLWVLVGLLILDNLGVEVNSLIASLGIGGIAVALAVQNVLSDLFASLSIAMDKPFAIGDFIVVDDLAGTVEDIGLKSTRVRSLSGEELVFSNSDLLNSRIRNYKRLQERRIVFSFGVSYDTPHETLQRIPSLVEDVISPLEHVRFDRAHLQEMGDFALLYEVVYFVEQPEYDVYMDVQEAIILALQRRFNEENIELPYPTQRVLFDRLGE
jgi:small-conductance mechanosensitive channel